MWCCHNSPDAVLEQVDQVPVDRKADEISVPALTKRGRQVSVGVSDDAAAVLFVSEDSRIAQMNRYTVLTRTASTVRHHSHSPSLGGYGPRQTSNTSSGLHSPSDQRQTSKNGLHSPSDQRQTSKNGLHSPSDQRQTSKSGIHSHSPSPSLTLGYGIRQTSNERSGFQRQTTAGSVRSDGGKISLGFRRQITEDTLVSGPGKPAFMGLRQRQITEDSMAESVRSGSSTRSHLERLQVPVQVRNRDEVAIFSMAASQDYSLDIELGVGAFGTVYKGKALNSSEVVAVKIIPRERLHSDQSFMKELKVARKLSHPNIVRLHASYESVDYFYLVMEFCPGGSLATYVSTKGMEEDDMGRWTVGLETDIIAKYAWQMLSGAAYLHYYRIVHRDIKLENYMRMDNGRVSTLKLIDMGLATRLTKKTKRLHEVVGTVLTMAPEVLQKDYDEKTDIWAIGMVLYMCAICMDPWYNFQEQRPLEEPEIVQRLSQPETLEVPFYEERWALKAREVRSLVETLLVVDPKKRPRARKELASNPWLRANRAGESNSCCVVS
ncbi:unnamed protein product [Effrenium voratum]|nr:unnamed protein product [Effrenium voratum]